MMTEHEEQTTPLAGQRVLVVEDQYLIAEDLCTLVEQLGGTIMGPVSGVEAALDLLQAGQPDLVMLDVNLEGERVYKVCTALREAEIPFVFITGYDASVIHPHFRSVPHLEKPIEEAALRGALARL
ncbi:response regulator [Pararoseomonas indoligenes]|uniref:Response regulator n=1 Tax=Roseomonas indoligenes TaxID=2820811 RepID=A0A940MW73_9PROT|nr:response regulator [Pararoseomonas indoligenes]MBP0495348.1 response regulator [Pararoseomonas indoligenes]